MRPNALQHSRLAHRLDPQVRQILSRLPEEVINKLSEEELLALYRSITTPRNHSIDLRLSLPLVPKRLYFVTLVGLERRDASTRTQAKSQWNAASVRLAMGISLLAGLAISGMSYQVLHKGPKVAVASETTVHPTALPWIGTAANCKGKSRQWKEGLCYEQAHSPDF